MLLADFAHSHAGRRLRSLAGKAFVIAVCVATAAGCHEEDHDVDVSASGIYAIAFEIARLIITIIEVFD